MIFSVPVKALVEALKQFVHQDRIRNESDTRNPVREKLLEDE